MNLSEAKKELNKNGYELIDEGFFKDAYTKYKNTVLKQISKYGVDLVKYAKEIEDWIRDYFVDKMTPFECALAIRDNCK